jgi:hypothetical protein
MSARDSKNLILRAESREEMTAWVVAISDLIKPSSVGRRAGGGKKKTRGEAAKGEERPD